MKVLLKSFGEYATNCYIVEQDGMQLVVDPGKGSFEWIGQNVTNLKAILCTHGHFDHIFDVLKVQNKFKAPIYIHEEDAFWAQNDIFGYGYELFTPDVFFKDQECVTIGSFNIKFHHFAGHTPGCSMIEINGCMFSGDFLFRDSIGRWDFPYSNKEDMLKSLEKCSKISGDYKLYPGHGEPSSLSAEQSRFDMWIRIVASS
ncbi:MBL fold metallo-hydrolase [Campylobacter sp. RM13119]|uniref:MBL fold metallo-hydrolase n=1 Tax=Campylobacter californiensis TaxID=1032243 RepID=UPI0014764847|nr:MBL fold metallo-hydrolase [Campylobacter sp. RM13119]MBE3605871.1 MBL fold metallo-hydrolase [Campylobacter sp. RM13119]